MKKENRGASFFAAVLTAVCAAPFLYLFIMSFLGPEGVTGKYYYRVFLGESQYLLRFWRSLGLSLAIAAGQLVLSLLAGFGFAKCRFPGRDGAFFLLMVLMILPLQVTLVPNYMMLDTLGLLDTYYALALPAVFVPLGTFIMTNSFRSVPNDILEAARLDGCGNLGILFRIAAPMNKSALVCTMLLSFLDGWNMVEQPLIYLKEFADFPIAVGLASEPPGDPGVQLVCCILVMLPPLLLFSHYNRELVEGIVIGGEK